ncbi:hypothetical protein ACWDSF_20640 [Nocardia beijingensis]
MVTATVAGAYLLDLAERLALRYDSATLHAIAERASGGQLDARRPDGQRASALTVSGTPLEVSVSGGRGSSTPAIRYVTETATQETDFATRVAAQLAAIRDLVRWLPNGDETVADMFHSFVTTLYPEPAKVPAAHRSPTWIGVVHHSAAPNHAARIKVYGGPAIVPGGLQRLSAVWPEFAGLAPVPDREQLITPVGAAIEVDAKGDVSYKIYSRAAYNDAAVPMKLVRYFGEPAWEMMSELVRCGVDATDIPQHDVFVCCARGPGEEEPAVGLTLASRKNPDLTALARELAERHHGTTTTVDALARAAESSGASWRYSAVGLGFSADHGIDKLNVYGTPDWSST